MLKSYNKNKPKELADLSANEYGCVKHFMKLQTASNEFIHEKILERESAELNRQLKENENEPEVCFINSALALLEERRIQLKGNVQVDAKKHIEAVEASNELIRVPSQKPGSIVKYEDAFLESISDEVTANENVELVQENQDDQDPPSSVDECQSSSQSQECQRDAANQNKPFKQVKTSINQDDELYYMYQSSDGQRIFMNSLNLRCLLHEYGTVARCPSSIRAKIVAIDNMFMNEDLRKRFKYLSHLPLHSDFKIVELDLVEPILSSQTLSLFEKEIESKRFNRSKKEKEEIKKLKRYESTISKEQFYTNYSDYCETRVPVESIPINYNEAFPVIDDLDEHTEAKQSPANSSPPTATNSSPQQFSFAQALKHETIASDANGMMWPKLNGYVSKTPVETASIWGKSQLVKHASKLPVDKKHDDVDNEGESDTPVPGYQESFLLAIDAALESAKKSKLSSCLDFRNLLK
jgi:hypothetical protein